MSLRLNHIRSVMILMAILVNAQVNARVSFRDNLLDMLEVVSPRFEAQKGQYERFEVAFEEQSRINELPTEREKIIDFHKSFESHRFIILDKETEVAELYDEKAELVETIFWPVMYRQDDTFAGRFQLTNQGEDEIVLVDDKQRKRTLVPLFNVDLPKNIYVLPTNNEQGFIIRDGAIEFQSLINRKSYANFNYTQPNYTFRELKIVLLQPQLRFDEVLSFLNALEVEKRNLMKLYDLTNDEYNQMVKLAFGIMGNESEFGNGIKYALKETFPSAVALAKNLLKFYRTGDLPDDLFDESMNSRGLTQIKKIPKKIENFYQINKENLYRPREAAITTLGFLAQTLQEIKYMAKRNDFITYKNRIDLIPFIYSGRMKMVIEKRANPKELNYLKAAKKHAKSIAIYQKIK